jgi:hypothetical protein
MSDLDLTGWPIESVWALYHVTRRSHGAVSGATALYRAALAELDARGCVTVTRLEDAIAMSARDHARRQGWVEG